MPLKMLDFTVRVDVFTKENLNKFPGNAYASAVPVTPAASHLYWAVADALTEYDNRFLRLGDASRIADVARAIRPGLEVKANGVLKRPNTYALKVKSRIPWSYFEYTYQPDKDEIATVLKESLTEYSAARGNPVNEIDAFLNYVTHRYGDSNRNHAWMMQKAEKTYMRTLIARLFAEGLFTTNSYITITQ